MPWEDTCVMDLKLQLIADWQRGCAITDLAYGYNLSRKTVYKWINRYQFDGLEGLKERSHAAHHRPHAISEDVAEQIILIKRAHPSFDPKKVMDLLRREQPDGKWPADSTAGEVLKRAGFSQETTSQTKLSR